MKNISTLLAIAFLFAACDAIETKTELRQNNSGRASNTITEQGPGRSSITPAERDLDRASNTSTERELRALNILAERNFERASNTSTEGELNASNIITQRDPGLAPNTLSEKEKAEGWRLLYDGRTKDGWHVYLRGTDGSAWKSHDGVLFLDAAELDGWQTKGGGDLVTDSLFENFHLSLEWKISDGGNSGILFNVQEDPMYEYSWYTGPEMQILDNNGHVDGQTMTRRAGDLVGLIKSNKEPANGPGRWNSADIRIENGQLDMFLNGKQVISTRIDDGHWKKLIEESEFKYATNFGMFSRGRIALQDHGFPVWFRNIRIREL